MPKGRGAVLAGVHEAKPRLAVRQRQFIRFTWIRRLSWLCRSDDWHRLRVRDEPNGDRADGRSARYGAQRCTLFRYSGVRRVAGGGLIAQHWRGHAASHDDDSPCVFRVVVLAEQLVVGVRDEHEDGGRRLRSNADWPLPTLRTLRVKPGKRALSP